jgi:hypothetical protein
MESEIWLELWLQRVWIAVNIDQTVVTPTLLRFTKNDWLPVTNSYSGFGRTNLKKILLVLRQITVFIKVTRKQMVVPKNLTMRLQEIYHSGYTRWYFKYTLTVTLFYNFASDSLDTKIDALSY